MSGDPASSALARQRFDERKAKMVTYEKSLGLPELACNVNEDFDLLNISGADARAMNVDELDESMTDLTAYGVCIQRSLNKERALMKWLDSKIELAIANELNNYSGYYSHVQRRAVSVVNNAYAKELEELKIATQVRVEMLEGLPYQINQLCRMLGEIKSTKRNFNQR
jgi:hypothetical protein